MKKIVTDDPQDNMEVMMNLAFVKDKEVWIRGGGPDGEDCTLIEFQKRLCKNRDECNYECADFDELPWDDVENIGDVLMDCSMDGCPQGTAYFIAIQAAELRERLRVCEPIYFHCMGFQDAEKILTYAGIGCDVLSPDGFIRWLKTQIIRDPRFKDEFRGEQGAVKPEHNFARHSTKPYGMEFWYTCGSCGTEISESDKFCHECGQAVKWND